MFRAEDGNEFYVSAKFDVFISFRPEGYFKFAVKWVRDIKSLDKNNPKVVKIEQGMDSEKLEYDSEFYYNVPGQSSIHGVNIAVVTGIATFLGLLIIILVLMLVFRCKMSQINKIKNV